MIELDHLSCFATAARTPARALAMPMPDFEHKQLLSAHDAWGRPGTTAEAVGWQNDGKSVVAAAHLALFAAATMGACASEAMGTTGIGYA